MKSEWRVTCNPVCGINLYRVYRLRDVTQIDHSGNREFAGNYTQNRDEARATAETLNNSSEEVETS